MAEDQDQDKTEEPTSRKIEEAVKNGQVINSKEVASFLVLVVVALNIVWLVPIYSGMLVDYFTRFIAMSHSIEVTEESARSFSIDVIIHFLMIISLPLAISLFAVVFAGVVQHGLVFSWDPVTPKLEKISVLKGFERLFSMRSVVEFIKGIIKVSIIGFASYSVIKGDLPKLENTPGNSVESLVKIIIDISLKIVIISAAIMMIIAIADYLYQRFEYLKSLRMTKQEIKEEYKQTEGSPEVKSKLRQIRMERSRRRMMAQVPNADVVIRNPTHYAIALEYKEDKMTAPKVVAMGLDLIALNIIKVAEENKITVVTNRPLAKALYENAELDEEIPIEHYKAVADVIGYVYKLKGKKTAKTVTGN
jgi:flagellar biosynthetic protein FlhB